MPDLNKGYIAVGKILGVFGNQGWIKVRVYSGISDRFSGIKVVYLRTDEDWVGLIITGQKLQGLHLILKLNGVENREVAKDLIGNELYLPESEKIDLPQDHYFIHDLVGLQVFNSEGKKLGIMEDVIPSGGNDLFVVKGNDQEYLVPAVSQFILSVDKDKGRIIVRLWEEME